MSERLTDAQLAEIEEWLAPPDPTEKVWLDAEDTSALRALLAEVKFMKERYEPKEGRWSGMSYMEWVGVLSHSHNTIMDWQKKCEQAAADERAAISKMLERKYAHVPSNVKVYLDDVLMLIRQERGEPESGEAKAC